MQAQTVEFKKETIINCGEGKIIYQISPSRQYWFIRSEAGNYYNDFIQNGYIAIGWDYLKKSDFKFDIKGNLINEEELKELIGYNEPSKPNQSEKGRKMVITKTLNKVFRFLFDLEEGDIVITPSENTNKVSIGIIIDTLYEDALYQTNYLNENPDTTLTLCPFIKRRKVHWLKHIDRNKLDIYLLNSFQSQEAMTCLNDQAQYINRNLYDAYIDGNCFHSIIKNMSDNSLNLSEITKLFNDLSTLIDTTAKNNNLSLTSNDVEIKINAHSPLMLDLSFVSDAIIPTAKFLFIALGTYAFCHPKSTTEIITKLIDRNIEKEKNSTEIEKVKLQEETKLEEIKSNERIELAKLRQNEINKTTGKSSNKNSKIKKKKRNPSTSSEKY